MNEITNEAILDVISVLLVIGAFAVCGLYYLAYDMEQDMKRIQEGERDTDPQPYGFRPDAEYVRQVLEELGLRKNLPTYPKRDAGTSEAEDQDIADLKRGTSDNLRGILP